MQPHYWPSACWSCGPPQGPYVLTPPSLAYGHPAQGGANDAEDCCLSVALHPIPGNIVRAFRHLHIQDGCRVPAVVFTTKRGRKLCAPPDQPWVDRIIRRLEKKAAKNKRHSS
ncbi:PREDICTED: C-C motif chemokine 19 isoform X1 [Myotis davidii]|uniref:C-C motif chemokine 19 isoform X1 n=1 Tax=Myotis davidii TaxID=225400 RepID=UPI000767C8C8|nr:PREDICTED: C-C motif chemokine 19 isoform X1 [Myotis davidii]